MLLRDVSTEMATKANELGQEQISTEGTERELIMLKRQTLYNVAGTFENTLKQISMLNATNKRGTSLVNQTFSKGDIEQSQFYDYDPTGASFNFSLETATGENIKYNYKDGEFSRLDGQDMTKADYDWINKLSETIAAARTENKESEYYDEGARKQYFDDKGNSKTDEYKLSDIVFMGGNILKRVSEISNYLDLDSVSQKMLQIAGDFKAGYGDFTDVD